MVFVTGQTVADAQGGVVFPGGEFETDAEVALAAIHEGDGVVIVFALSAGEVEIPEGGIASGDDGVEGLWEAGVEDIDPVGGGREGCLVARSGGGDASAEKSEGAEGEKRKEVGSCFHRISSKGGKREGRKPEIRTA